MERFGEKLRVLRERQNMSQWELGNLLGFRAEHVSKLERGIKQPHAKLLIKIADLFGVTVDQLVRDELEV